MRASLWRPQDKEDVGKLDRGYNGYSSNSQALATATAGHNWPVRRGDKQLWAALLLVGTRVGRMVGGTDTSHVLI